MSNKSNNLNISKTWAMPCKNTFDIKPIKRLIEKHLYGHSVDPFANSNKLATVTNDLDPSFKTDFNLDALDFLKQMKDESVDVVLFDPPYSPRQVSECYKSLNKTVNMQTTQSSFWGNMKKEVSRVTKQGGKVLTFGWNSGGIGKTAGFKQVEILMVAHGGWHNDTIATVEIKGDNQGRQLDLF